jgi:hypothetical protein
LRRFAVHRASRAGALLACAAAALAGCGASDNDPGPGGVTVGEARALDEAAEMLDEQRLPSEAAASPAPTSSPEPEPAAQGAGR